MSRMQIVEVGGERLTKCYYGDQYRATRRPTCGCDVCAMRWEDKLKGEQRARIRDAILRDAEQMFGWTEMEAARQFPRTAVLLDINNIPPEGG